MTSVKPLKSFQLYCTHCIRVAYTSYAPDYLHFIPIFSLQSTIVLIRWHPAGSLAFVCGSGGEIQCYDLSLNSIMFQSLSEDPSPTLILPMASYLMYVLHTSGNQNTVCSTFIGLGV